MMRTTSFVVDHPRLSWAVATLSVVATAWLAGDFSVAWQARERQAMLNLQSECLGDEIVAQTLNCNLMGAVGLLGLIDPEVKQDARGEAPPNQSGLFSRLESLARAQGADGAFVVGDDLTIKSSWGSGKSLTGVDVKFRPYARMVKQGKATSMPPSAPPAASAPCTSPLRCMPASPPTRR